MADGALCGAVAVEREVVAATAGLRVETAADAVGSGVVRTPAAAAEVAVAAADSAGFDDAGEFDDADEFDEDGVRLGVEHAVTVASTATATELIKRTRDRCPRSELIIAGS